MRSHSARVTSLHLLLILVFIANPYRHLLTMPPVIPEAIAKPLPHHPVPRPASPSTGSLLSSNTELVKSSTNFLPPLRTHGRYIVDSTGARFKLASINWYGASDERWVAGGLDILHRSAIAQTILDCGYNSVRFPYSDEMVRDNPIPDAKDLSANPDLIGLPALDVFNACVEALTDAGIAVIINDHITNGAWCDGLNICDSGWRNDYIPFCRVKQTEKQWVERWTKVMTPLANNPLVIGVDLRNEPRGPLLFWPQWASAAEKAGNHLLKLNPNWLVIVEGIESANNLRGAADRPVQLSIPNRLVYSSHVYKWSGWGEFQTYGTRTYESFASAMDRNWGYLLDQNIAPVWVGEIGAPYNGSAEDKNYWFNLMRYLEDKDADYGYWAINTHKPHHNANESYSIVHKDWVTPRDDYRTRGLAKLNVAVVNGVIDVSATK